MSDRDAKPAERTGKRRGSRGPGAPSGALWRDTGETSLLDEKRLLEAARAGDATALERLLERWQPRVFRFGLGMCGDPDDAQDVLQETLLSAVRTLPGFRGEASPSTWLYAIARSHCSKKRRRSKFAPARTESLEDDARAEAVQVQDPAPAADEALASREVQAAVERAIASLDSRSREVLLLRDVEGLSALEVAAVLGLRVEAIKSRLHRARLRLRERLLPLLGEVLPAPGPGCPDVLATFSRHLEGDIDAERCAVMEEHLAGCGRCGSACESLRRTLALCKAVPEPVLPDAVRAAVRSAIRDFLASGSGS